MNDLDGLRAAPSSFLESEPPARAPEQASESWAWRSEAYAWWVVVVLAVGMALSMVDRLVIAAMIEPIKADLGISDTQVSLLHGLAFTLLYVVMGLPLGWLADRWSRRAIAGISLLGWSVATIACGLAASFTQLFVARMTVGVGEAGMSPAAVSLISDYLPPAKRARGLLALTLGTTVGGGLALIFGGVAMHVLGEGSVVLPLIGPTRSWQVVFLILGLFGSVYSLMFLSVREPLRRERIAERAVTTPEVLAYVWERRSVLAPHFLGVGTASLVLMAMNLWVPSFLVRTLGWSRVEVGLGYGACLLGSAVTGVFAAGAVTSRLIAKGRRDAALLVASRAVMLALPPLLLAPLVSSPYVLLPLLFVGLLFLTMPAALGPVFIQSVCANEARGQVVAIYLLVIALIGNVLGPVTVAVITDYVIGDARKVNLSLLAVVVVFVPLAIAFLAVARRNSRREALASGV